MHLRTLSILAATMAAGLAAAPAQAADATHCAPGETDMFSCKLKKGKIVSLCASADLGKQVGYLQYRFGPASKIEFAYPKEPKGAPQLRLTRSADKSATYDDLTFVVGHFTYELTSFRQLQKKNASGLDTPESSDTLSVRDDRKSMREGDIVFNDDCAALGKPLSVGDIAAKTGAAVEKGGF